MKTVSAFISYKVQRKEKKYVRFFSHDIGKNQLVTTVCKQILCFLTPKTQWFWKSLSKLGLLCYDPFNLGIHR